MCMWHAWSLHDSDIINEYVMFTKLMFNMKSIEVEEDIVNRLTKNNGTSKKSKLLANKVQTSYSLVILSLHF